MCVRIVDYHGDQSCYLTRLTRVNHIPFDQAQPLCDNCSSQSLESPSFSSHGRCAASRSAIAMARRPATTQTCPGGPFFTSLLETELFLAK